MSPRLQFSAAVPNFSQLDPLWAVAQALGALRSPGAQLLPVLAAAVQVTGQGEAGEMAGDNDRQPDFVPCRAGRRQPRPPRRWRPGRAEPATSARRGCCSPTRGPWRWRPCCGPCWRGCRGDKPSVTPLWLQCTPNKPLWSPELPQSICHHVRDGATWKLAGGDGNGSSRMSPVCTGCVPRCRGQEQRSS